MPNKQSNISTTLDQYYRSIVDLPLRNFIDVAVNENLNALVISGDPSIEDLAIAWHEINNQYADAMGDNEHRLFITLYKEVAILSVTYSQIEILVGILSESCRVNVFPADLYKELNSLTKSNFSFLENDNESNLENINRCKNRSKSIKIQLDIKEGQLKAMEAKEKKGKITKEHFYSILITISDHVKYNVHDDITVFEFCERVKRHNDYNVKNVFKNKK